MKFYMPTRVFDEYGGCVAAHAAQLASFGKRALVVTGRHSAKANGSLEDVAAALSEHGTEYCVFDEVEENPSIETIMKARDFGVAEGVDFVIGIGGGSPLDAAKAIALMIRHADADASYLYDREAETTALPVAAIPTTCGTGSEVTGVSVLTDHKKRTKASLPHRIFPDLALVDGKYLFGKDGNVPLDMIRNTSFDALAHMIESDLTTATDDYSKMVTNEGLAVWGRLKPVLRGEEALSPESAQLLMRASTYAGIAIAQAGTAIPHALSYILTYEDGIPHGKAAAYFLPRFVQEAPEEDRQRILRLTGFESMDAFAGFFTEIFGEVSVAKESLERTFDTVFSNPVKLASISFPMDEAVLRRIVWG